MSVRRGASVSISSEISSLEPLPGRMNSAGIWQYSEIDLFGQSERVDVCSEVGNIFFI